MDASDNFWIDIHPRIHQYCLRTFTPSQLAELTTSPYDNATKLHRIQSLIRENIPSSQQRPLPDGQNSHDADEAQHVLSLLHLQSSDYASYEASCRRMLVGCRVDQPPLAALSNLTHALNLQEKYAEAEGILRGLVPLLQEKMGAKSPQALGGFRKLAEAVAGLGRTAEAWRMMEEIKRVVDGMEEGELKGEELEAINLLQARFPA